jgi:hypothetical protein
MNLYVSVLDEFIVLTMYLMALVLQERRPERIDQVGVLAEGAAVGNKQLQLR